MNTREQLRLDWAARIADFRASGLTMSAWCKTNQCTIDQLKYWLYKAKGKSASSASTSPARWGPPLPWTTNQRIYIMRRLWLIALEKPASNFMQASTRNCFAKLCRPWNATAYARQNANYGPARASVLQPALCNRTGSEGRIAPG